MERIAEKLVAGEWKHIDFGDLRLGDVFRLFDIVSEVSLGEPLTLEAVQDDKGNTVFIAESDPLPYVTDSGVETLLIETEPYEGDPNEDA